MNDSVVANGAEVTDSDPVDIASDDTVVPDGGPSLNDHFADYV